MSNFHKLLNKAYREIITEQEQPPIQQDPALAQATQPAPEQAAPTPMRIETLIKNTEKKE